MADYTMVTRKGRKKRQAMIWRKTIMYRNNIPSKDVSVYLVCPVKIRCQLNTEIL